MMESAWEGAEGRPRGETRAPKPLGSEDPLRHSMEKLGPSVERKHSLEWEQVRVQRDARLRTSLHHHGRSLLQTRSEGRSSAI